MSTTSSLSDADLLQLLHDWRVVAEYDGGYVLGRCVVCGAEDLLDGAPPLLVRLCAI